MIETIQCGIVNCYLIKDSGGSILVDTGLKVYRDRIYEAVKDKNVKLIVLTHGHDDHIGNAAYLKEKLHVPIAMNDADYKLTRDNTLQTCRADTLIGKIVLAFSKPSLKTKAEPFEVDLFIEEGDDLDDYGVNAEVIELPGHTAGSIGIVTHSGVIVGDAMMNLIIPYGARLYTDKQQAEKSLQTIQQTGLSLIYPGHGKPIEMNKFFKEV